MKSKKWLIVILTLTLMLVLSACAGNQKSSDKSSNKDHENMNMDHKNMDMGDMHHSSSGEVPKGLKVSENPTYKVGSKAIMKADHMEGMDGAVATIVGAYETTVFAVSYTPTNGGEKVKNHKWVIHEEINDPSETPYLKGDPVILNADHMPGMKGAKATIESAEHTTVYMVDYTSTTGEKVKNHQWATESELLPE